MFVIMHVHVVHTLLLTIQCWRSQSTAIYTAEVYSVPLSVIPGGWQALAWLFFFQRHLVSARRPTPCTEVCMALVETAPPRLPLLFTWICTAAHSTGSLPGPGGSCPAAITSAVCLDLAVIIFKHISIDAQMRLPLHVPSAWTRLFFVRAIVHGLDAQPLTL